MQQPTPGSHWRHYKSDGTNLHTYEVIGIAVHSETHEDMVVYRSLYDAPPESWAHGYTLVTRPLSVWYDIVEHV